MLLVILPLVGFTTTTQIVHHKVINNAQKVVALERYDIGEFFIGGFYQQPTNCSPISHQNTQKVVALGRYRGDIAVL